jgi:hypothetical protein
MPKDTYYFPHDYNARNDRKIAALVKDYKSSGYGIFWATCEMMHEEGGSLEFDDLTIGAIAKDLNEDTELVRLVLDNCVVKYRLFTKKIEAGMKQNEAESFASKLHSGRVIRNLDEKNGKRQIKAEAGRLGGIKSGESRRIENVTKQNKAVLQPASSNEAKESKVKESKVDNIIPYTVSKIPYTAKTKENMVVLEMIKIFKEKNPSYFFDEEKDYPACLQIAYKIARAKGWKQSSVVDEKEKEVLASWKTIVDFIRSDNWLKTRSMSDISDNEWQRLVMKMGNGKAETSNKNGQQEHKTAPTPKYLNP